MRNIFRKDETDEYEQDVLQFVFDEIKLSDFRGIDYEFEILNKFNDGTNIEVGKEYFVNGQVPFHKLDKKLSIKNKV